MIGAKHTPGPWAVSPAYSRVAYVIPAEHLSRPIGCHTEAALDLATFAQQICSLDCPDRHRSAKEMRANARLIAAAPDLLVIASRLAALAEGLGNGNSGAEAAAWRLAEEAHAVITKVQGEAS